MSSTVLAPSTGSLSTTERIERALQQIDRDQRQLRSSTVITLLISLVVIGLLAFYLRYAYVQIREVTEPQILVDAATSYVEKLVPETRTALQNEIKTNAPAWAASLSASARESVPTYRSQLEDHIVTQAEQLAETAISLTDNHVRSFMQSNKNQLQGIYNDLAAGGSISEQILDELAQKAGDTLGASMQASSLQLNRTLRDLVKQLADLKAGESLDEDQKVLRHAIMVARRVQLMSNDAEKLKELDQQAKLSAVSATTPMKTAAAAATAPAPAPAPTEKKPAEEPKAEAAKPATDKPATEKAEDKKPAPEEPAADKPDADKKPEQPSDEKPAETKPTETKPEETKTDESAGAEQKQPE